MNKSDLIDELAQDQRLPVKVAKKLREALKNRENM
jgi:hypothetical protein